MSSFIDRFKNLIKTKRLISFTCNICEANNKVSFQSLDREVTSCNSCGSTVRMRGMVHALSLALYGKSLTIQNFPENEKFKGIGMSDWDGYALPISKKLDYTNTFYHKEPHLDITQIDSAMEGSLDFILTTDVFEHVAPPCTVAFENSYKLLKPNGYLVISVPYTIEGDDNLEHFPDLYDYNIETHSQTKKLVNKTRDGKIQTFSSLVFHGGPGTTLEMRVFSKNGLLKSLKSAGFKEIKILGDPYLKFGIHWPQQWSLPIIATK